MFVKYQHVEKFGTSATRDIEKGTCYIFPKIDGTNASVWAEENEDGDYVIRAGSRNRELGFGKKDNHSFYAHIAENESIQNFFQDYPDMRLFGEWLVPHTIKTYRDDAWRQFYVFDVCRVQEDGTLKYYPYENYQPVLEQLGIKYLAPLGIVKDGNLETFAKFLDKNTVLIKDNEGTGEGIVIKNYDFVNQFGNVVWAKIVKNEFKEKHNQTMGAPKVESKKVVEEFIVREFLTEALIIKTYNKILVNKQGWESSFIPQLLNTIYHDFITEELWDALKKTKFPTVDFRSLQYLAYSKIKKTLPEVF